MGFLPKNKMTVESFILSIFRIWSEKSNGSKKSKEQIHYNMSRVRNSDTALEKLLCEELIHNGVTTYTRNNKTIFGKPDIAFIARKIAVFCDGDFWHGYDWANAQNEIKSNRDFWISKIERNMHRDLKLQPVYKSRGGRYSDFGGMKYSKKWTSAYPPYWTNFEICRNSHTEQLICVLESEASEEGLN